MIRKAILCSLALWSLQAIAVPYERLALDSIVTGTTPQSVNLTALDDVVRKLALHASRFPVQFDEKADDADAQDDAVCLSDALESPGNSVDAPSELLLLAGTWNTLAWRMDYAPAADRAVLQLTKLLDREPDNLRAHYLLGSFFTEFRGGADLALPHLERAHQGGLIEATYSLAMVNIQRREIATAKNLLENFAARTGTTDVQFKRLLAVISRGNVHVTPPNLPPLPASAITLSTAQK